MAEPRVLIVDDQPNWREVLSSLLSDLGWQTETASDLPEAKRKLAGNQFRAAIIDVRLVDKNPYDVQGVELLEYMQEHPELNVPAVIMTGYSFAGLEGAVKAKYGVRHFVDKGTKDISEWRTRLASIMTETA
jgi:two-component system, NtrC family, response regulator PilR